jgi:hypothetical protein
MALPFECSNLTIERDGTVYIITMRMGPENRLNTKFCQEMISAFNWIRQTIGSNSEGAVITRGKDAKYFCTVRCRLIYMSDCKLTPGLYRGLILRKQRRTHFPTPMVSILYVVDCS